MLKISRDNLPLGGFAGLKEHRLVTDRRVFGLQKAPGASDGLGGFVYLADARFDPYGDTGMHPHRELDVISVMVDGRIAHEGSMAHGTILQAGDVQVQRAGGEGFLHNEVNPDGEKNRMIQMWVLPEQPGQAAGYKAYSPEVGKSTRIYGGNHPDVFDSRTHIDIVRLNPGQSKALPKSAVLYMTQGEADVSGESQHITIRDGDLLRAYNITMTALEEITAIVVTEADSDID